MMQRTSGTAGSMKYMPISGASIMDTGSRNRRSAAESAEGNIELRGSTIARKIYNVLLEELSK